MFGLTMDMVADAAGPHMLTRWLAREGWSSDQRPALWKAYQSVGKAADRLAICGTCKHGIQVEHAIQCPTTYQMTGKPHGHHRRLRQH